MAIQRFLGKNPQLRYAIKPLAVVTLLAAMLAIMVGVSMAAPAAPLGKSTIGDYVWHDQNLDGVQDAGETGINGVIVNLYQDLNGNGTLDFNTELISTTVTVDNPNSPFNQGWYDFKVDGGERYWVEIPASNFDQPGDALYNYVLTSGATIDTNPTFPIVLALQEDYNDADFGFAQAAIHIVKTAGNAADGEVEYIDGAGDVTYTYEVTNTGDTYLRNVTVADNKCSPVGYQGGDDGNNLLDPGGSEVWTFTCTTNISVDTENTGTAQGEAADQSGSALPQHDIDRPGPLTVQDSDDAVVDVVNPAIQIVKTAGNAADGEVEYIDGPGNVTYTYDVTNTGDTYLSDIVVTDDNGTPNDSGDDFTVCTIAGPLAPNGADTCTSTRAISQDTTNVATASGNPTDDQGNDLPDINDVSDDDDAVVDVVNPAIQIVKTAGNAADGQIYDVQVQSPSDPPAASVTYTYKVTNQGDTPLAVDKNSGVTDNKCSPVSYQGGDTDNDGLLDLNEEWTFTCTATLNADTTNIGAVTGNPTDDQGNDLPDIDDVTDNDDAVVHLLGSLGDFVWWDIDKDGSQDTGEPGIPDVTVQLLDSSNNVVQTTSTDNSGMYRFDGLRPGTYTIRIPSGEQASNAVLDASIWHLSSANQAADDKDSDGISTAQGIDITTTLNPEGEVDLTNDFGFYANSSYTITKTLDTAEPVRTGDPVEFTIRVENTGDTWLAVVPLVDTYDTNYLTYVQATPASNDNVDDGTINWSDITGSGQLAPGGAIEVVVTFTAFGDTTDLTAQSPCQNDKETCNVATADNPKADADGPDGPLGADETLNDQQDWDDVEIINPTAVALANHSADVSADRVVLHWTTVNESKIVGFNVYRMIGGLKVKLNHALIVAERTGQAAGAAYQLVDDHVSPVNVRYILEFVMSDGRTATQKLFERNGIFLPLAIR